MWIQTFVRTERKESESEWRSTLYCGMALAFVQWAVCSNRWNSAWKNACIICYRLQKEGETQNKIMSRPVFCVHSTSNSFQFCHSYHQQLFLEPFPLLLSINLMPNDEYRNDVKMILPSFHCSSWQFQTISIHSRLFYAGSHEDVRKWNYFKLSRFKNKH